MATRRAGGGGRDGMAGLLDVGAHHVQGRCFAVNEGDSDEENDEEENENENEKLEEVDEENDNESAAIEPALAPPSSNLRSKGNSSARTATTRSTEELINFVPPPPSQPASPSSSAEGKLEESIRKGGRGLGEIRGPLLELLRLGGGKKTGRGTRRRDIITERATGSVIGSATTGSATGDTLSVQISSTSVNRKTGSATANTLASASTTTTTSATVLQPPPLPPTFTNSNSKPADSQPTVLQTPTAAHKRRKGFYISGGELERLSGWTVDRDKSSTEIGAVARASESAGRGLRSRNRGGEEKAAGKSVDPEVESLDDQEEERADERRSVKGLFRGKDERALIPRRKIQEAVESTGTPNSNRKVGEEEIGESAAGLQAVRKSGGSQSQLQLRSQGELVNEAEAAESIPAKTGIRLRIKSGVLKSKPEDTQNQWVDSVEVQPAVQEANLSSTKSGVQRNKSRRASEVERLGESQPVEENSSKTTPVVLLSNSTRSGVQRSKSRRSSEVGRLREGQPALVPTPKIEQHTFGSVIETAIIRRSSYRRSSEAQLVDKDQNRSSSRSIPKVETLHQSIEEPQSEFARPTKRKSDTFGNQEGSPSLSRAKSVKFHHPSEPTIETPSLASHRSGKRKSESQYLLDAQAGTPFQLPVGFEGSSTRSLRSQSIVEGVKDVTGGILEAQTVKKVVVVRRSKSRVVFVEDIVAVQSAPVEKALTQANKLPLRRIVSTRNRALSLGVLEAAPLLQASELVGNRESIEAEASNKNSAQRTKSRATSSGSKVVLATSVQTKTSSQVYLEPNEESIVVEPPKKKAAVSRSKSQITSLTNSKSSSNHLVEEKDIAPDSSIINKENIQVEAPKKNAVRSSGSKLRAQSSKSRSSSNLQLEAESVKKTRSQTTNTEDESSIQVQASKFEVKASVLRSRSRVVSLGSKINSNSRVEPQSTVPHLEDSIEVEPVKIRTVSQAKSRVGLSRSEVVPNHLGNSKAVVVKDQEIDISDEETNENSDLPPNTICIINFLKDAEIKQIMPDLDESVLTRARRRAEGPRGERLISRRRSSSQKITGLQRANLVNGTRAVSAVTEIPSAAAPLPIKPSSPNYIEVDITQMNAIHPSKSGDSSSKETSKAKEKDKPLERNIDNVIFGDVTFKAWYPSWYPKEIIGEKGLNGDCKGIVVPDLYVCHKCFGYAKTAVDWVRHTRCCEKDVPGEKIYTHGPDAVWSIWEVDGDVDTLFCQNLSLFAKLFLDNKSVFFDVLGFKYFLLVHTSPVTSSNHVVGFFSKEKMSWDNNNLACILVFPPWQRKSLGTLLMGISYAISKREQILGGPEKPISDLGKKGYKRYWGAEIARWLLGVKESDKKKGRGMVTVGDVSQGTWIVAEDCLSILREMGVVEKAGRGKGVVERVKVDKEAVRVWVAENGIKLEMVVDESGFREGYALKEVEEGEEGDVEMEG